MSRSVSVHHFVLTEITRPRSHTWRACDLFGVSYWREVPADTEFPFTVARMNVFSRFYLSRAKPADFRVRVLWDEHPSGIPELIGTFGPYPVSFASDAPVHDCSFNLHNVRLQGVGIHSIELFRERVRTWTANEWVPMARTYFAVER